MSTNFTIWAASAALRAVDGSHYTESLLICKPLFLLLIKSRVRLGIRQGRVVEPEDLQEAETQKPAFAGFREIPECYSET
ncbi:MULTISPECIES: hypothetical protein [unclassified Pseudomonas]|uniref:hypothetical protein n=1 Tax=unclassified Pseudomonas TaxID=196821 RepID=UPI00128BFB91|nr:MULTISPECIES: hypothetical protein [unclassified Pseudomonas]MPQ66878.1 hypothetical protein [Pseudomonas sp. MWU12-2323]